MISETFKKLSDRLGVTRIPSEFLYFTSAFVFWWKHIELLVWLFYLQGSKLLRQCFELCSSLDNYNAVESVIDCSIERNLTRAALHKKKYPISKMKNIGWHWFIPACGAISESSFASLKQNIPRQARGMAFCCLAQNIGKWATNILNFLKF